MTRPLADNPAPEPAPLRPLLRFDAGWLFLGAGLALVAATVLISASFDLDRARRQKDNLLAIESHHLDRIDRHVEYLDAVVRERESVVISLAHMQLNLMPADRVPLDEPSTGSLGPVSVFASLEPERPLMAPPVEARSRLERWSTEPTARLWLLAGGVICILIGVMPSTTRPA